MLRERAKLVIAVHYASEIAVLGAAFRLAYDANAAWRHVPLAAWDRFRPLLELSLACWAVVLWFTPSYFSTRVRSIPWTLLQTLQAGALTALLVLAGTAFLKMTYVSRGIELLAVAFGTAGLGAERVAVRLAARWVRSRGRNYRQVVVVGLGGAGRRMARVIDRNAVWGLRIVGFFAAHDEERPASVNGHPVLGGLADLPAYLANHVVDEVVLCVPRQRRDALTDVFLKCDELGIRTRVVMNFLPKSQAKVRLEELDGIPMLTYSRTPAGELALAAKRAIDIVASAVALALLAPVLGAVALAIRMESRGAVLFRQRRVGLYGRAFTLFKFRSMYEDAESRLAEVAHLNEMDGPVFKIRRDPRVTVVGKVLRRLSLDELPQLVNVLQGHMSLVGPRPPVPAEVERYQAWQRRRLSVKPGLTCLWQVSGRNHVSFQKWMRLDLEYIDNWSLWLDLKILARTVPVVLGAKGAW